VPAVPLHNVSCCFLAFAVLRDQTNVAPIYGPIVRMPIIPGPLQLSASELTLISNKGSRFQEASGNVDLSEMRQRAGEFAIHRLCVDALGAHN